MNITLTDEQKLELAEWLVDHNYHSLISGSLMLKQHGIDLGRPCGDIDIIIDTSYMEENKPVLPPFCKEIEVLNDHDGYLVEYRCTFFGTKIEFIADDTYGSAWSHAESSLPEGETYPEFACIYDLLNAKRDYVEWDSNGEYIEKTKKDIEIIERWLKEHPDYHEYSGKTELL